MQDVKTIFRDEALHVQGLEEANQRLSAENPDVDKEIGRVEAQAAKTQARVDRYFEAFEAGTMKPELCDERSRTSTPAWMSWKPRVWRLRAGGGALSCGPLTGRCSQVWWTTSRT